MTKEERKLWYEFLKDLPVTVKRQEVIGQYIVDFYCHKFKTAIELDGSQHYFDNAISKDKERDRVLQSMGITVLRFTNTEINSDFSAVCEHILIHFGML